jgi:hypothetical protein
LSRRRKGHKTAVLGRRFKGGFAGIGPAVDVED